MAAPIAVAGASAGATGAAGGAGPGSSAAGMGNATSGGAGHGPRPGRDNHAIGGARRAGLTWGLNDLTEDPGKLIAAGLAAIVLLLALVAVLPAILVTSVLGGSSGISDGSGLPAAAQPFLGMYDDAGSAYTVNPFLLMSIHEQETNYGTSDAPGVKDGLNFAGCCAGPMQFFVAAGASNSVGGRGATWARYAHSYDRAHLTRPASYPNRFAPHPNVYDSYDAIYAAASYLQDLGAGPRLDTSARTALVTYSGGSASYVSEVLSRAHAYEQRAGGGDVGTIPDIGSGGGQVIVAAGAERPGVSTHQEVLGYIKAMSGLVGVPLTITVGTNHSQYSASGLESDHWTGWAADLGSVANHFATGGDAGTRIAAAALIVAGVSRDKAVSVAAGGGLHNVYVGGWRIQVIWRASGHYDHVHVGLKQTPAVPNHLETIPY